MAAYRPGVLMGNWKEDMCLEEERVRDFIQKRERGELLTQKINRLNDNLFKKVKLSVSTNGFVCFGDTVMLLSPSKEPSGWRDVEACGELTLAVNLEEVSIYSPVSLRSPCAVSAISTTGPVGRNTFCILSVDGGSVGEPVKFGQKFGLGTTGGFSHPMFYLGSDHRTFMRFAKKTHLQQVFLTDEPSYLTCWQANFLDPQMRLEYEGIPVPANCKLIITHCHTNRSLAVPRNFWGRSYFGREYEVICHTYLDSHRAEEDKNYWVIVTGNPGDDGGAMHNRPEPQPGGTGRNVS
ncbi:cilia- and flagella-associated protein 161 isoform X1 [Excalfactoria chinensis]|uniref:cilia- and flagella-associated protein 161 isoform X1 n=1 Tax=Excalfactoria chinensis TaxID=46218 RepID=UPI003B3B2E0B